jgi:hypothetical protein
MEPNLSFDSSHAFLNESMDNKLLLLVRVALLNKMFKKLNSGI